MIIVLFLTNKIKIYEKFQVHRKIERELPSSHISSAPTDTQTPPLLTSYITVVYLLRIPLHYIDIHYIHTYTILLHCYHLKLASNSILKKQRSWPSSTVTSCQIEGGKVEAVTDFVFLGPKSLRTVTEAMKLKKKKNACSFEGKL